MLQLNQCVGSYSAGTDTNPIYMFSTAIMDARNQIEPWPSIDKDKDKKDSGELFDMKI
jgi:RB1-inducible coiled-coil protein 1